MKTALLAAATLCFAIGIYAGATLALCLAVASYVSLAVASAWLHGDRPEDFHDK